MIETARERELLEALEDVFGPPRFPRERKGQWGTPSTFWDELMSERLRRRLPSPWVAPKKWPTCCSDVEERDSEGFKEYVCHRHSKRFNAKLTYPKP